MLSTINTSNFKPSFEMSLYIENLKADFRINRLKQKRRVIYVSGPATGIDNYTERFSEVVSFLESNKDFDNFYIINPMLELDSLNEYEYDGTYNDKIFLSLYLLSISNIIVIDDRSDKWKDSKGVMIELTYALSNNKSIISYSKLLDYYNGNKDKELDVFFGKEQ